MIMVLVIVMVRKKLLVIPRAHGLGRVRPLPHVHGGVRARGGAGHQVIMLIMVIMLSCHHVIKSSCQSSHHVNQVIMSSSHLVNQTSSFHHPSV